MITIGLFNTLEIIGQTGQALLLDGGEEGRIPLPKTAATRDLRKGDAVPVFIYTDEAGYLVATLETPLAQLDEVAWLQVLDVTEEGVWLDWGLEDDLFMPRREQFSRLEPGRPCMVKVYLDEEFGLVASRRLDDFLQDEATGFSEGEQVSLLVGESTSLGYKVVVNHRYWGMVYADEVFQRLHKGQKLEGYIKRLRPDRRLDVSLTPTGYAKVDGITQRIMDELGRRNGFIPLSDKSSPEDIYALFGVSKKAFKQAIGSLFRQQRIMIEPDGISLVRP